MSGAVVHRWVGGEEAGYHFRCPVCRSIHGVRTAGASVWTFNGDEVRPTFSPSVLVKSGHYAKGREPGDCWCDYEQRTGETTPYHCYVCHSFVTDGQIQFLGDCTHELAGQTVPLPPWEEGGVP